MPDRAGRLADAARALVDTPFRLQGRDPAHGLDCLGVVIASLDAVGVKFDLPADYRPHRRVVVIPADALATAGLIETRDAPQAGDILLLRTTAMQVHTGIALDRWRIVHAHAGLRRVVASPLTKDWPVLSIWRLAPPTNTQGDPAWQR